MIIPNSPEVESAVIGQFLMEPSLIRKAGLKESDFHNSTLRRVYRSMESLFQKGQNFDLVLLAEKLNGEELEILNRVSSETFTTGNFPLHVSRLRELSAKRKLQKLCADMSGKIQDQDVNESALRLRQGLSEVTADRGAKSITGADLAAHGWKRIESRVQEKGSLSGISCGLKSLDDHLNGFQPSELYLIAGRPSMGKTAFALNILLSAARAGFTGAFLSLEMGREQIEDRLFSTLSSVALWKIRRGILMEDDWGRIAAASQTLSDLPIHFSYEARNLKDVTATAIDAVENQGAKIIFADYLQLIRADGAQNREREISMISSELKNLAVSLKVPVVALSQLSRAPEKREDRKPALSDLRDSGSLEQDADAVILLYRKNIAEPKGPVEFIIAKGRNCGCGIFSGYFDGETQRFFEIENSSSEG